MIFSIILINFQGFLTDGKTCFKSKYAQTQNPSNYRPKLYKIITSIVTNKIEKYLEQNKIQTEQSIVLENETKTMSSNQLKTAP